LTNRCRNNSSVPEIGKTPEVRRSTKCCRRRRREGRKAQTKEQSDRQTGLKKVQTLAILLRFERNKKREGDSKKNKSSVVHSLWSRAQRKKDATKER
jgi:hypothetical protein